MRPKYQISEDASLRDAMRALDQGAIGAVFVTGSDDTLLGVVTDGDVRRALLRGRTLDDPVRDTMTREYRYVTGEMGRSDVLDLMQACWLEQIPVVDEKRRLVGVHVWHEILGRVPRPNWAVVLAGGKGTRLRPLTDKVPKPMVAVAGRPILERIVLHLVGFGIGRIFLAVNFLGDQIQRHFGDGARYGCRIEYLEEQLSRPLGTGGSLSLLPEPPAHPTLVMNGDLVTQFNVADMLEFHERGGCYATMGIRPYVHAVPFGCVTVREGRVVDVEEKPDICRLINAGIYVLSPEAVADVPEGFFPMTDLFAQAVARGKPVGGFTIDEEWIDVGRFDQLRQANGLEP